MKLLIVIDMQNDFVTGCLGTPEARALLFSMVDIVYYPTMIWLLIQSF